MTFKLRLQQQGVCHVQIQGQHSQQSAQLALLHAQIGAVQGAEGRAQDSGVEKSLLREVGEWQEMTAWIRTVAVGLGRCRLMQSR